VLNEAFYLPKGSFKSNSFLKESLDQQFCTLKGMFKTNKQPFYKHFLQNNKYLAWSDPNSQPI